MLSMLGLRLSIFILARALSRSHSSSFFYTSDEALTRFVVYRCLERTTGVAATIINASPSYFSLNLTALAETTSLYYKPK